VAGDTNEQTDVFVRERQGPAAIRVAVDIKPGEVTNTINLRSQGVLPVAILSTLTFDARVVDALSVRFGPAQAREAHGRGLVEDVNGDGRPDLLLHFRTQDAGLTVGMTTACLTGTTAAGVAIEGCDAVRLIAP
jgi:hypothetical protein